MTKTQTLILALLVVVLTGLVYLEANEPKEVNWSPSYTKADKIPLGAKVLFDLLKQQELPLKTVKIPPYETLQDSLFQGTYFFLNDRLNLDHVELDLLLEWIKKGNTAFLISENFSQNLLDTLQLQTSAAYPPGIEKDFPVTRLVHPDLKPEKKFRFPQKSHLIYFSEFDSIRSKTLGVAGFAKDSVTKRVNYLRISLGKGNLYLHAMPQLFSNYFMLDQENFRYAENALAYLPKDQILHWDSYYKSGKAFQTSPLYVLLEQPALRWAYYILLVGVLLFVLFQGKRRQRSIPVVQPLQNQTYAYTRMISGLYLRRKDYKAIADKKIQLFLMFLRSRYHIKTETLHLDFQEQLAKTSGYPLDKIRHIFDLIQRIRKKPIIEKNDLLELDEQISAFKKIK